MLVSLLGVSTTHSTSSAALCEEFEHPISQFPSAAQSLQHSVLLIVNDDTRRRGTAFLVDRDRRLFLTARHVVITSDGNPASSISGYFKGQPNSPVRLGVHASLPKLDVALIRVQENERAGILDDKPELELSFRRPASEYFGMLTAAYGSPNAPTIRTKESTQLNTDRMADGTLAISITVAEGSSGAPILRMTNALVVGVVLKMQTTGWAIIRPVNDLAEFLETHSSAALPVEIKEVLREPMTTNETTWQDIFRANRNRLYSNFNLAGMVGTMWQREPWPQFRAKIGDCEIYNVADSRELGVYSGKLFAMANRQDTTQNTAEYVLNTAEASHGGGYSNMGRSLYVVAKDLYGEAIGDALREGGHGEYVKTMFSGLGYESIVDTGLLADTKNPVMGLASGGMGAYDFALWEGREVVSPYSIEGIESLRRFLPEFVRQDDFWFNEFTDQTMKSDSLAKLFYAYAKAGLGADSIEGADWTRNDLWDSFVGSAWGSELAVSREYRAANLDLMGDILLGLGMKSEASKAYVESWKSGIDTELILDKFMKVQDMTDADKTISIQEALQASQGIDGGDIRKIINICPVC